MVDKGKTVVDSILSGMAIDDAVKLFTKLRKSDYQKLFSKKGTIRKAIPGGGPTISLRSIYDKKKKVVGIGILR